VIKTAQAAKRHLFNVTMVTVVTMVTGFLNEGLSSSGILKVSLILHFTFSILINYFLSILRFILKFRSQQFEC